jgi:hypothetical protein
MTHTPASGPLALVTTPPISSLSTRTVSVVCSPETGLCGRQKQSNTDGRQACVQQFAGAHTILISWGWKFRVDLRANKHTGYLKSNRSGAVIGANPAFFRFPLIHTKRIIQRIPRFCIEPYESYLCL